MNMAAPSDHFQHLWALGYHNIVPIIPPNVPLSERSSLFGRLKEGDDARGKTPGRLNKQGKWASFDWPPYEADEYDLRRWRDMKAGVGVICRDDVRGIDVDTLSLDIARSIKADIDEAIGPCPLRIGRRPKALYVVRVAGEFPYHMFLFGPQQKKRERVEILAGGKQFVAYGVHPGTMKPYEWAVPLVPYDELPVVSAEVLADLVQRWKARLPQAGALTIEGVNTLDIDQNDLIEKLEVIRQAVVNTPNTSTHFSSRESYRNFGYGIKASLRDHPDEAFDIFTEWCSRWADGVNEPEIVASDWRRMKPPFRRGASWLLRECDRASGGDVRAGFSAKWFEVIPDVAPFVSMFPDDEPTPRKTLEGDYYDFPDPASIEPEDFLYDSWLVRDYVSLISAQTKVGKSLLMITVALAMASGKPLLGKPLLRKYRVRIWNGEDTRRTMSRRIAACMLNFGLVRADIEDRLIVNSGRDQKLVVGVQGRNGAEIKAPVVNGLISYLQKQQVDVLVVDPFIKAHSVSENDNAAIDAVAQEWVRVADQAHVGVVLVHHSRKLNGNEASVDDSRGASALPSAARATLVLARMTSKQAKDLGKTKTYKSLFRIADAASNLAAAPGDDEEWFEITSVDLGNARFAPDGTLLKRSDRIGVARLSATVGLPDEEAEENRDSEREALAEIATGVWRKDVRAGDGWAGVPIARAFHIDIEDGEGKAQVKAIIKRWIDDRKIDEESRPDKNRIPRTFVVTAKQAVTKSFFD